MLHQPLKQTVFLKISQSFSEITPGFITDYTLIVILSGFTPVFALYDINVASLMIS